MIFPDCSYISEARSTYGTGLGFRIINYNLFILVNDICSREHAEKTFEKGDFRWQCFGFY